MWGWLTGFGARRRKDKERAYWALREAEAMRMQHHRGAERACDVLLAQQNLPARRRRFLLLVRKQLAKV
jgi:hypothetical protein